MYKPYSHSAQFGTPHGCEVSRGAVHSLEVCRGPSSLVWLKRVGRPIHFSESKPDLPTFFPWLTFAFSSRGAFGWGALGARTARAEGEWLLCGNYFRRGLPNPGFQKVSISLVGWFQEAQALRGWVVSRIGRIPRQGEFSLVFPDMPLLLKGLLCAPVSAAPELHPNLLSRTYMPQIELCKSWAILCYTWQSKCLWES